MKYLHINITTGRMLVETSQLLDTLFEDITLAKILSTESSGPAYTHNSIVLYLGQYALVDSEMYNYVTERFSLSNHKTNHLKNVLATINKQKQQNQHLQPILKAINHVYETFCTLEGVRHDLTLVTAIEQQLQQSEQLLRSVRGHKRYIRQTQTSLALYNYKLEQLLTSLAPLTLRQQDVIRAWKRTALYLPEQNTSPSTEQQHAALSQRLLTYVFTEQRKTLNSHTLGVTLTTSLHRTFSQLSAQLDFPTVSTIQSINAEVTALKQYHSYYISSVRFLITELQQRCRPDQLELLNDFTSNTQETT